MVQSLPSNQLVKNSFTIRLIVSQGQVIARAHNLCERLRDFTAHAEMQAFTSASEYLGGKFLDKCTLYVTLEPCPMCAGAAFWTRIGRVVYGASDPKRGALGGCLNLSTDASAHHHMEVIGGVRGDACREQLQAWFRQQRNPGGTLGAQDPTG